MSARVTVLVAVHNGGNDLRLAVESVLAQTFGDFELLVVDDASTDGAAQAIAPLDPRIRIIRNERNLGQAPSLNRGLEESAGEYIARLDHDDLCRPARLERQVAVLDAEPRVAVAGTWIDVVDEHDRLYTRLRGALPDFPALLFALLVDRPPLGHPALLYRRDVVCMLGGYDVSYAPAEDKDLYRRLALAGHEMRIVPEPLIAYRRHPQQLSQRQADTQKANDARSQEAFLAALAGERHAHLLRLVLSGGDPAWTELRPAATAATIALEALLSGTRKRFQLPPEEARRLQGLVAAHVARRTLSAWRGGAPTQWRWAPRVYAYAARTAPGRTLPLAPILAGALVAAPVLAPLAEAVRRGARFLAGAKVLAPVRRALSRSRLLRWLYARAARTQPD